MFQGKLSRRILKWKIKYGDKKTKIDALRKLCFHIGDGIEIFTDELGAEPYLISIDNNSIIASGVKFITHDASVYTVYRYLGYEDFDRLEKKGAIKIGKNCFIGAYSIVCMGADIGDNCVIAAGSFVNSKIPDNEVWGGIPAHFIMSMDEYSQKVYCNTESIPWINKKEVLDEKEVIRLRQEYYF